MGYWHASARHAKDRCVLSAKDAREPGPQASPRVTAVTEGLHAPVIAPCAAMRPETIVPFCPLEGGPLGVLECFGAGARHEGVDGAQVVARRARQSFERAKSEALTDPIPVKGDRVAHRQITDEGQT